MSVGMRLLSIMTATALLLPLFRCQATSLRVTGTAVGMLTLAYPPGQTGVTVDPAESPGTISSTLWHVSTTGDAQLLYRQAYSGHIVRVVDPQE